MKRLLFILFLFISSQAFAFNTWYSRNDGGTNVQCSGVTDAPYTSGTAYTGTNLVVDATNNLKVTSATHNFTSAEIGNDFVIVSGTSWTTGKYTISSISGNAAILNSSPAASNTTSGRWISGPGCAFNHPSWALGAAANTVGTMQGGDTLIIDDVDELAGSGQAQYMVGAGMPNYSGPNCDPNNFPYGCGFNAIKSGPDSFNTTKVYGKKWNNGCSQKPQLWGTQSVGNIMAAGGDNIDVQCIEMTQHSSCSFRGPIDIPTDGDPTQCPEVYPTTVKYTRFGFSTSASIHNLNMTNIYIHNTQTGLYLGSNSGTLGTVGNINLTNVYLIGNQQVGMQTGINTNGDGTITWINSKVEFSGCSEHYPLPDPSNIENPINFHHCWEQNQGGYGDGVAFGNAGTGTPGNWVFKGGSYSWNTSDGIDTLHGDETGSVLISRILAEGNSGQAIKATGNPIYIENNIINNNCSFFDGQSWSSPTSSEYSQANCLAGGGQSWDTTTTPNRCLSRFAGSCRANGSSLAFRLGIGKKAYIYNNTINSGGANIVFELNGSGRTCNGTTDIQTRNNIYIGGWNWLSDTYHASGGQNDKTTLVFNDGGSTDGSCNSITLNSDYNLMDANFKNGGGNGCSGAHDQCNVDPLVVGQITNGHGSVGSYYHGTSYYAADYLQSSSPARSAGTSSLTYQNGSLDFNTNARPPWDIGALIYGSTGSCTINGNFCSIDGNCCSGHCCSSQCSATSCSGGGGGGGNPPLTGIRIDGALSINQSLKIN